MAKEGAPAAPGEMILLDYELWAEGGAEPQLIDTTRESVATQAGRTPPEGAAFGPRAHLLKGDHFPAALETAIAEAAIGKEVTKTFPPADAFGERDPKLIELFSMHEIERLPEMRREDAHLDVGTVLTIRGRRGRVASLTAARVRVDFNPPFAGRPVRLTFKAEKKVEDAAEIARGILDIVYGRGSEFEVDAKAHAIAVRIPDRAKFDLAWFAGKSRVVERLRTVLHPKSVEFIEEYVTPVEKPSAPAAAASGTEAPSEAEVPKGAGAHRRHPPKAGTAESPEASPPS